MKKKILKFVIIGILVFVAILAITFCCIYAIQGDNTWNYIKEFLDWYKTLFFI